MLGRTRDVLIPGPREASAIYAIAVALNYPWELLQSPLFTSPSHKGSVWLHCFGSSLGDGLMILMIFLAGCVVFGRRDWFVLPGPRRYVFSIAAGAILAVVVESVAVHVLQRWAYADAMPVVPGVDLGIVPILQMVLLSPLIFLIAAHLLHRPKHQITVKP